MIRAVLYTRKSNEQYGVAEADKSVTRQSDLGRAFVESKGWSLVGEYEDDGITGGDFVNRTGLTAMRDALKKTPRPFDVIVAMDGARIGRDQFGTPGVLQDIADAGVRLWYYQAGREAILTDSTGRFGWIRHGFANEQWREKCRKLAIEGRRYRVSQGRVATGRVFGYVNGGTKGGRHRVIEPTQAPIVVRVFEMAAQGFGYKKIADILAAERVPSPRRTAGRTRACGSSYITSYIAACSWRGSPRRWTRAGSR